MASIDELLGAAEYILAQGNQQVILCERGIRTFETATRNTLDLSAIPILKERTHLPVIVDPSHASGRAALVPPLAAWTRTQRLGLIPPKRLYLVAVAPVLGVLVAFLGNLIGAFVPSTSEASIESLVAFSSGALALGLVSVVVPVAEELFFRGLIFGNLERRLGGGRAFLVTIVLFALAHLPQQWGNWGAASSVLFAGVVFTALRWRSGSTLVPVLAHLAHNAILVFSRF